MRASQMKTPCTDLKIGARRKSRGVNPCASASVMRSAVRRRRVAEVRLQQIDVGVKRCLRGRPRSNDSGRGADPGDSEHHLVVDYAKLRQRVGLRRTPKRSIDTQNAVPEPLPRETGGRHHDVPRVDLAKEKVAFRLEHPVLDVALVAVELRLCPEVERWLAIEVTGPAVALDHFRIQVRTSGTSPAHRD